MIQNERGNRFSMKTMLAVFIVALFFALPVKSRAQNLYNGEEVYVAVEEMPSFPGGEKALHQTLYKNVNYPAKAAEKEIEGKVLVKFIITKDGSIANATVTRPVDPDLDKAALDAVKKLPNFIPGKKDGKPVNVWFSLPIVFKLYK